MTFENNALIYLHPETFEFKGVKVAYIPLSMKGMMELKEIQRKGGGVDPVEIGAELRMLQEELEDHLGTARARLQRLIAASERWQSGLSDHLLDSLRQEAALLIHNCEDIEDLALERWTPGELRYVNMVIYSAALHNSTVEAMDRGMRLMKEAEGDEELKKKFTPTVQALLQSIPLLPLSFSSGGDTGKTKSSIGLNPSFTPGSNGRSIKSP